ILYPQNGSIANGSCLSLPTVPAAAAVISDETDAPRNTPCCQLNASVTNGMNDALLPPKIIAEIGTPFGSSHAGSITGHCPAGVVNREFGCDDGLSEDGVQSFPCQSIRCAGASSVIPSHHTSPSSVRATFVKIEFSFIVSIAFALVLYDVPGATPKNPASGLIAYNLPSSPNFIHAMSSPTVS